jgi:hypothetical protein
MEELDKLMEQWMTLSAKEANAKDFTWFELDKGPGFNLRRNPRSVDDPSAIPRHELAWDATLAQPDLEGVNRIIKSPEILDDLELMGACNTPKAQSDRFEAVGN